MARAIFVVIPTAGRPKLLRRTLASLAACEKPSNYRGTYVVENGPKGEAEWIVEAHRSELGARYLYLPGANKSRALNAALEQVEDGLIFFTDDDVRLAAHVLSRYAEASADVDGGFFYGGPLGVDYERQPPEWVRSRLPPSAVGWC